MDREEFKLKGKEMIDYICNFVSTLGTRKVTPLVEPGYLKTLIDEDPPYEGESWDNIMKDVEEKIIPGMTHWQHPRFHAYFPSGNCFASILGDLLCNAFGSLGISWSSSPACTELETIVLDWFGKMIGLPEKFLFFPENSRGGGVIQSSASECILVCLLSSRASALKKLKQQMHELREEELLSRLVAYCSKESHSCVEKAAMISFVKIRILETDENFTLRKDVLRKAVETDVQSGLVPFFVSCTLGTTSCCSFDNLNEVGQVCKEFDLWLHVDAAYAGSSFICPELRYLMEGVQYASSFNTNPNKFLLVNFDCSVMWVTDRYKLMEAFVVDPRSYPNYYADGIIDYRHWGMSLSRRFRSMKLWLVIRDHGIDGLQKYVRNHCNLAKQFKNLVESDARFEVMNDVKLGLVCFRLKGSNKSNEKLLADINESRELHMVPSVLNSRFVIRFAVCAPNANEDDIVTAWKIILKYADAVSNEDAMFIPRNEQFRKKPSRKEDEIMTSLSEKDRKALQQKRSFFVRMVSNPKIYMPTIASSYSQKAKNRLEGTEEN